MNPFLYKKLKKKKKKRCGNNAHELFIGQNGIKPVKRWIHQKANKLV